MSRDEPTPAQLVGAAASWGDAEWWPLCDDCDRAARTPVGVQRPDPRPRADAPRNARCRLHGQRRAVVLVQIRASVESLRQRQAAHGDGGGGCVAAAGDQLTGTVPQPSASPLQKAEPTPRRRTRIECAGIVIGGRE